MIVRKLIFAGSATALGIGLAGIPAGAFADNPPSIESPTQPTVSQPIVTQSAGTFTVTLPGVGSLSFGVDPTSGALTALTVTPAPGTGFVAGAPMTTEEGVQVLFTGPSGSQLLEVKVDRDEAVTEVKAEVEPPPAAAQAGATPGDDRGDDNGVDNDQNETTTTLAPDQPISGDDNGMNDGGDGEGQQQTTTTTTLSTGGDQSGSDQSGSSGDGTDGSGSSSGGSGDQSSDGGGSGHGDSGSGSGGSGGSGG